MEESKPSLSVRDTWHLAAVHLFFKAFGHKIANLPPFTIKDLANTLSEKTTHPESLLCKILLALLNGICKKSFPLTIETWPEYLHHVCAKNSADMPKSCENFDGENFDELSEVAKVELLHMLCCWKLDKTPGMHIADENCTAEEFIHLRPKPTAVDSNKRKFYVFDNFEEIEDEDSLWVFEEVSSIKEADVFSKSKSSSSQPPTEDVKFILVAEGAEAVRELAESYSKRVKVDQDWKALLLDALNNIQDAALERQKKADKLKKMSRNLGPGVFDAAMDLSEGFGRSQRSRKNINYAELDSISTVAKDFAREQAVSSKRKKLKDSDFKFENQSSYSTRRSGNTEVFLEYVPIRSAGKRKTTDASGEGEAEGVKVEEGEVTETVGDVAEREEATPSDDDESGAVENGIDESSPTPSAEDSMSGTVEEPPPNPSDTAQTHVTDSGDAAQ